MGYEEPNQGKEDVNDVNGYLALAELATKSWPARSRINSPRSSAGRWWSYKEQTALNLKPGEREIERAKP
jgi:hypothetical protein